MLMKRVSIFSIYFLLAFICRSTVPFLHGKWLKFSVVFPWVFLRRKINISGGVYFTKMSVWMLKMSGEAQKHFAYSDFVEILIWGMKWDQLLIFFHCKWLVSKRIYIMSTCKPYMTWSSLRSVQLLGHAKGIRSWCYRISQVCMSSS